MKKILSLVLLALLTLGAQAQTNFRKITYKEGLAAAKAEQKALFVDFYTSWCGPCKMMARTVFPQQGLGDFMNSHFVCLQIDAEKGEGIELAKRYQVNAYPTFVVISADDKELGRTVGGCTADEFQVKMEQIINPEMTPEKIEAKYNAGDRSADIVKAYAAQVKIAGQQSRDREAEEVAAVRADSIVQAYFTGLDEKARLAPENLFVYEAYTSDIDQPSARFMIDKREKFTGDARARIDTTLTKFIESLVMGYFINYKHPTTEKLAQLKKNMKKLAIGKDGRYDTRLDFAKAYATMSQTDYIDYCTKNYSRLNKTEQAYLTESYGSLITTDDKAVKTKAAQFLRANLATMDATQIYFTAMIIGSLEGTMGH